MKSLFLIEYDSLAFLRRKIENFYYDEESHWINRLRSYTSSIIFKRHFKRTSLSVLSMMRVLIIYNRGGTMYVWYPKIVGLLDFLQYYSIQCSISIKVLWQCQFSSFFLSLMSKMAIRHAKNWSLFYNIMGVFGEWLPRGRP